MVSKSFVTFDSLRPKRAKGMDFPLACFVVVGEVWPFSPHQSIPRNVSGYIPYSKPIGIDSVKIKPSLVMWNLLPYIHEQLNFHFCCESLKTSSPEANPQSQQNKRDTKVKFEIINILFDLQKVKCAMRLLRFPWNYYLRPKQILCKTRKRMRMKI